MKVLALLKRAFGYIAKTILKCGHAYKWCKAIQRIGETPAARSNACAIKVYETVNLFIAVDTIFGRKAAVTDDCSWFEGRKLPTDVRGRDELPANLVNLSENAPAEATA